MVSEPVTTNQLEQKTVEVPQEQIVKTTPMTQQVTDQCATVKQPKIFKMTTQRKHSAGQERFQVNNQVEDKVKFKIIKMKV